MPDDTLQKHTLNLVAGDYEKLQGLYPDVGAGPVIRRIVHSYLNKIEQSGDKFDPKVEMKL